MLRPSLFIVPIEIVLITSSLSVVDRSESKRLGHEGPDRLGDSVPYLRKSSPLTRKRLLVIGISARSGMVHGCFMLGFFTFFAVLFERPFLHVVLHGCVLFALAHGFRYSVFPLHIDWDFNYFYVKPRLRLWWIGDVMRGAKKAFHKPEGWGDSDWFFFWIGKRNKSCLAMVWDGMVWNGRKDGNGKADGSHNVHMWCGIVRRYVEKG